MNDKALVFVSCGQFTKEERQLGKDVVDLVNKLPDANAYFAQDQMDFEGVAKHIFGAIDRAAAFIAIMHKRGEVVTPDGPRTRASVWVEQEVAIASFLKAIRAGSFEVASYIEKGIALEGVREKIMFNPTPFLTSQDVLDDLKTRIGKWDLKPRFQGPKVSIKIDEGEKRSESTGKVHLYSARIILTNIGHEAIDQYLAEMRFPRLFVEPKITISGERMDLGDKFYRVFQQGNNTGHPLLPGESRQILSIPYVMNDDLYAKYDPGPEVDRLVMVRVFVGKDPAGEASRPFREIECF